MKADTLKSMISAKDYEANIKLESELLGALRDNKLEGQIDNTYWGYPIGLIHYVKILRQWDRWPTTMWEMVEQARALKHKYIFVHWGPFEGQETIHTFPDLKSLIAYSRLHVKNTPNFQLSYMFSSDIRWRGVMTYIRAHAMGEMEFDDDEYDKDWNTIMPEFAKT